MGGSRTRDRVAEGSRLVAETYWQCTDRTGPRQYSMEQRSISSKRCTRESSIHHSFNGKPQATATVRQWSNSFNGKPQATALQEVDISCPCRSRGICRYERALQPATNRQYRLGSEIARSRLRLAVKPTVRQGHTMVHGYHVILPMYGFWLPNDPRGSWSDFVRKWELVRFGRASMEL